MNLQLLASFLATHTMMNFKSFMIAKIRLELPSKMDDISSCDHLMMSCYYSVAFLGPSITPYKGNNPGYRIYELRNDTTFEMFNHHVYFLNLTTANSKNISTWQYLYDAKVSSLEIM